MQAQEQVRSVARAMQLLRVLQSLDKSTLAELQRRTGLPKPTLLRLLETLEHEKAVWRPRGDAMWRPAVQFKPTRILKPEHQRLIDAAMPALERLRERVVWPSDLAVREGDHMALLETTRRSSGLAVNRDEIGHRIDMTRSAVGRAFLAGCRPAERARVVRLLARARRCDNAALAEQVETLCAAVRAKGYATRDAAFGGHDEPIDRFDDQLAAIAVPIVGATRVLGCINIVWLKRFDARAAIAARHLKQLQQTAAEIAGAVLCA